MMEMRVRAVVGVDVRVRVIRVIVAVVMMVVRMPVNAGVAVAAAANLTHDRAFSCYRWCAIGPGPDDPARRLMICAAVRRFSLPSVALSLGFSLVS